MSVGITYTPNFYPPSLPLLSPLVSCGAPYSGTMESNSALLFASHLEESGVSVSLPLCYHHVSDVQNVHRIPVHFDSTSKVGVLVYTPRDKFRSSHLLNLHSSSVRGGDHGQSLASVALWAPECHFSKIPTINFVCILDDCLIINHRHQVYDWLILLGCEVEYIWRKKWNIPKILFILSRYGPFIDLLINLTCKSTFPLCITGVAKC